MVCSYSTGQFIMDFFGKKIKISQKLNDTSNLFFQSLIGFTNEEENAEIVAFNFEHCGRR